MSDSRTVLIFLIKLFIVFIIPQIIRYYAKRRNKPFWAYVLFFLQIGPRTDTKYMKKEELYKAGLKFLLWSVYLLVVILIIGNQLGNKIEQPIIGGLFFIIFILFMMCLFGGVYLLFRALIRSKNYIPPERTGEPGVHL